MSLAWFASFISLPTVIDAPGDYLTRSGERVSVGTATTKHRFGCVGVYSTGQTEGWHRSGRLYFGRECPNDIVSKAPAPLPFVPPGFELIEEENLQTNDDGFPEVVRSIRMRPSVFPSPRKTP